MSGLQLTKASTAPWGQPLLTGLNLALDMGAIHCVIGPNGAGKSTLLHLLGGGHALSAGQLRLDDRNLADWPRLERARAVSLLPQASGLGFPFTVEEVVQLGRTPHRSGNAVDAQVVEETLAATDTLGLRRRYFTELSGGERQRVQLARCLAQVWRAEDSPVRVLLLDEPTSALDLAHQDLLRDVLVKLAQAGCLVVTALHDFNLVSALADNVIVLQDGRLENCGPVDQVYSEALFERVFCAEVTLTSHPRSGRPLVLPR